MNVDPDRACLHEQFAVSTEINRIVNPDEIGPVGFMAELQVECANCGETFRWNGLEAGLRWDKPTCSVDETILNAPIRPASADPDFGLTLPGYAIGYRERPAEGT